MTTQAQRAERRTTVVTSAIVSAAIAIAITVSGLLVGTSLFDAPSVDPEFQARRDRAVQAGLEWQERYEQMYPQR